MRITRHIHFFDTPTVCVRHEFIFDPPYDMPSTLGKVDELYPGVDFNQQGRSSTARKVGPVVNANGILHIREVIKASEVLSILLRSNYRLNKLVIPQDATLQLIAAEFGIIYWITFGGTGVVEITGQVVKDDDGIFGKLKTDLTDTAMRAYLAKLSLADITTTQVQAEVFPELMSHDQAAKYLGVAVSTLYNWRDVPRQRHNKYRREDLDRYLASKPRRGRK